MAKLKQEKLAVDIQRYISEIIQFELKHVDIGMATVTRVKVSDDNSWAKVYVSFLDKDRETKLEKLKENKWLVRNELAKRLTIRKTPDINFVINSNNSKYPSFLRSSLIIMRFSYLVKQFFIFCKQLYHLMLKLSNLTR